MWQKLGLTRSRRPVGVVRHMPIIASWKVERNRSSLSRAASSASSLLSRTLSFRRHETIAARPAAATKAAWIPAHFHGWAIASGWLNTAWRPSAGPRP